MNPEADALLVRVCSTVLMLSPSLSKKVSFITDITSFFSLSRSTWIIETSF